MNIFANFPKQADELANKHNLDFVVIMKLNHNTMEEQ
ncbi:hypothetical protein SAMN05444274_102203 [Mariniphaga anaerophila]|uniref:Uncharacterized protein n=1 Tax=Mariniphaga anaerophila TaxID=1484053 RepID=A0A1M4VSS8_9BACT|nr:hypothetical protein SAMN05444274_102203 [Mariniphaga anaerophila]